MSRDVTNILQSRPPAETGTAPGQFPGPGLVGVEQSLKQAAEPFNPDHYDKPIGLCFACFFDESDGHICRS